MKILFIAGAFFVFIGGCAVRVETYQKPSIDFSAYSSWCWMRGCEFAYQGSEHYYDQRVVDEIANAIAGNMDDKGYVQGDDESDLLLNFYIILERDSSEVFSMYYGMFQDEREWLPRLYPEYQQFLKGSLIIDVLDRSSSRLIWRSNAVRYLEINPLYDREIIWKGVTRAMRRFPVSEEGL